MEKLNKRFYRIDGGGAVEHLSQRDSFRDGYSLCGARSKVGAWASFANENITDPQQLPVDVCKRCRRIAFGI
jgi:pyridoxine/pyridoxamine 5'-phosphate oxidase